MATYQAPPVYQTPAAPSGGDYPVQVSITQERNINRLWGIPFFGIMVRYIFAIPHLIIFFIEWFLVAIWMIFAWIPILLMGRQPGFAVGLITEVIRRQARIQAYIGLLMPGGYPPLAPGSPNPVDVQINVEGRRINQLWGIPIFGSWARFIVAIPHFIVLGILGLIVYLTLVILWIPILITGKYPGMLADFYAVVIRYGVRVSAYLFMLPVPYPPFSLS